MANNELDPLQRELLREAILLTLEAVAPAATTLPMLRGAVAQSGFHITEKVLAAELDYLEQRGLLQSAREEFSVGLIKYKLSATGREALEKKGLI
jgi:DNA-binding PadR family transcriptional regulator